MCNDVRGWASQAEEEILFFFSPLNLIRTFENRALGKNVCMKMVVTVQINCGYGVVIGLGSKNTWLRTGICFEKKKKS